MQARAWPLTLNCVGRQNPAYCWLRWDTDTRERIAVPPVTVTVQERVGVRKLAVDARVVSLAVRR